MNRILIFLIFVFSATSPARSQTDKILLTIGDTKVTLAEFERIYQKNNNNLYSESDKKSPEEYLDLFIDFKLKVIEAENLKMDTSSAFVNELAGYRQELAAPYLTDMEYSGEMIRELYDRTAKEVRASHILVTVEKNATQDEDREALEKIKNIRQEIMAGKDFNDAAKKYSQDPSAQTNKGDLGYFSAFQMVVSFENAAFGTPVGGVSEPVRSDFGYHLVKVFDLRENRGELKVAHIMKMFPKDMAPETKAQLKTEMDGIYLELQNGADFSELARTKSDDARTATKGGEMPWFPVSRMIPEFANPAFELKNVGDFTNVVETAFGYHIIKKLDHRGVKPFDEVKADLESRIKRDPQRSNSSKKVFVDKLKTEYNFNENSAAKSKLQGKTFGDSAGGANFELFNIDGKSFGLADFESYAENQNLQNSNYLNHYDSWVSLEITELENSKLEEKYPDFRYLFKEYHDGILLFNISEEKIWDFAAKDSTGLQNFYEKNSKNHIWEERFKGSIVTCKTPEVRTKAEKYFAEKMTATEVLDQINDSTQLIEITEGAWEKGSNPVVDFYVWNQSEPRDFDSALTFVRGGKIGPQPKTLEEARGLYVSDYQNFLEKEWLKQLRKKYKIKVNKKLLKKIEGV